MRKFFIITAIIILLVLPGFLGSYYTNLLTQALVFGLFAMAVNLLLGYVGLPSMGQAAFFGTAAYIIGLLSNYGFQNFWLAMPAGLVSAAILAAIFGPIVLRTRALYFLIITTALGQCLWGLSMGFSQITGGDDGIPGIARPHIAESLPLTNASVFYYFTFIIFFVSTVLLYLIARSSFGLTLLGIREKEGRMRAVGYNVWIHKYIAYILSAIFCGVAGALLVYHKGHVDPSQLHFALSAEIMLMCILGGSSYFFGPLIGAGLVVFIKYLVSAYTSHWLLALGAAYILTIYFAPNGVLGILNDLSRKWFPAWNI